MKTANLSLVIKTVKARNPFAFLASARRAGRHGDGNQRQRGKKDLVQRLREAGAI